MDELDLRVLEDEADRSRQAAGGRAQKVQPRDPGAAAETPAVEVRHQAVEGPQERRLAAPRGAGNQRETLPHLQGQVVEGRREAARVPVAQPVVAG